MLTQSHMCVQSLANLPCPPQSRFVPTCTPKGASTGGKYRGKVQGARTGGKYRERLAGRKKHLCLRGPHPLEAPLVIALCGCIAGRVRGKAGREVCHGCHRALRKRLQHMGPELGEGPTCRGSQLHPQTTPHWTLCNNCTLYICTTVASTYV
jgi:hypothetical protein